MSADEDRELSVRARESHREEEGLAPLATWLIEPLDPDVRRAVDRVRRLPDVRRVVLLPDVHLASDVTIGTVVATSRLIYPQAVGGDIGCGMLAVGLGIEADRLADAAAAGRVLAELARAVPTLRHHRARVAPLPEELGADQLSHDWLRSGLKDEGALQIGTPGSGNHFVELQADDEGRMWLMVHSGSRVVGQMIKTHHMGYGRPAGGGMACLDAEDEQGRAYLRDVEYARRFAKENRRRIAEAVVEVIGRCVGGVEVGESRDVDHNHVARELHGGEWVWVHRKGAMPAHAESAGVVPGSMGTASYHVEGLGCEAALCSSAHGAGRAMSRVKARRAIAERELHRQMEGVWYDYRMADVLREEGPGAYKDVRAVMRAQRELAKVVRVVTPVLNYKGR